MRSQINDDSEARLMMGCAGVLKKIDEAPSGSKPGCRCAIWELDDVWHLGVRWFNQPKPEDNGYAVFISDDKADLSDFAGTILETADIVFAPPDL